MGKEIVDINDGKPSARARNFHGEIEEKKGLVGRLNEIELYTIKYKMFFFKNYPSVISISRVRQATKPRRR